MTKTNDLSGIQSPRLGLGYDSGWAHLSGNPQGDSMSGIDFDEIAAQAASEVFGRAGGGHPFVRGAYAAGRASTRGRPGHPAVRAAYRAGRAAGGNPGYDDYYRAGWGAPGWDAGYSEGDGGYYEDPSLEDQELQEEEDALRDDDEYGLDAEFGRSGGRQRRQQRRQHRRQRRRSRREHRRATQGAPSWDAGEMDAYREPLGMEMMDEEDPYYIFEEEEYGGYDPQDWHGRRGGPVVAQEEAYGRYGESFDAANLAANEFHSFVTSSGLESSNLRLWIGDDPSSSKEYTVIVDGVGSASSLALAAKAEEISKAHGVRFKRTLGDDPGEMVFSFYGGGREKARYGRYGQYQPGTWHGRRGGPVVAEEERYGQYQLGTWHGRRGGPVVVAEELYGEAPVSAPTQEKSSFRTSLETGLGVGLGMMGAIVAVNLVARAFSGRR